MLAATELVKTSRGFDLECEADDDVITRALRETGEWEEWVARAIDNYLKPGWTFLDIGAHVGYFSLIAAARGNPVVAIEPNPSYEALLRANARRHGLNIQSHVVALSDFNGQGWLVRDARFANNPAASYLVESPQNGASVPVPVCRLQDLIGDLRPEFVKLDIEGMELCVLRDSPEVLDAAQVIIVEAGREMAARAESSLEDLLGLLNEHGFVVTFCDGSPLDDRLNMPRDYYTNLLARKGLVGQTTAPVKVMTTATILLCAWRNLVAETAECLLALRDRGWGYVIKRGDALITRSRAAVVSSWYRETQEDVFLMIDDDVVFEISGAAKVVELAREKRSIACAAYPVKDGGHLSCRRIPGTDIRFGPDSPSIEIVYPATGFMAVHRDVITAMIEARKADGEPLFPFCDANGPPGFWPFFDVFTLKHEDGKYESLSEDYAFGEQARRLGFTTWLDPSVILYHMGTFPYTIENMKDVVNYCGLCGEALDKYGAGHREDCESAK